MKKNGGITLISLVVTVLILLIISSVSIQVSVRVYNDAKLQNYISKLKVIQAKVDNLVEASNEYTDYSAQYGFTPLMQITLPEDKELFQAILANPNDYNIHTDNSWNSELDSDPENYYYFNSEDLQSKLGLTDQDMTVIINFKTRNVITKDSVKADGKSFYRQYDVNG